MKLTWGGRPQEYAEITQLSCLLEEIVARVPVPPTCVYFGPLDCQTWILPELKVDDQVALREAFQEPTTVVQMVLWGPNHYGSLQFRVAEPPVDWVEAYEPPRVWQCQFFDHLPGGHEGLAGVCQRMFQHVKEVTNLQGDALPAPAVPQGWFQKDTWSCGYHSARYLEVQRRLLRGERPAPIPSMEAYVAKNKVVVEQLQRLQCQHLGIPWPLKKPSGPEDQKGPGDEKGPGHEEGPGHQKGPLDPKPPRRRPEPDSLEEALARAAGCSSCSPRKTGPYAGQKGCPRCMGSWFESMRTKGPGLR